MTVHQYKIFFSIEGYLIADQLRMQGLRYGFEGYDLSKRQFHIQNAYSAADAEVQAKITIKAHVARYCSAGIAAYPVTILEIQPIEKANSDSDRRDEAEQKKKGLIEQINKYLNWLVHYCPDCIDDIAKPDCQDFNKRLYQEEIETSQKILEMMK